MVLKNGIYCNLLHLDIVSKIKCMKACVYIIVTLFFDIHKNLSFDILIRYQWLKINIYCNDICSF